MRRFLGLVPGLAAAGLLASASAAEPARGPAPALELLESGRLVGDLDTDRWSATGGVRLRRGELTLRAERASWDAVHQSLSAEGGVLLSEPGRALAADSLRLEEGGAFEARGVRAWLKARPGDLSACPTGDAVAREGRNRVTFSGDRLAGHRGEEAVQLDGARITLCDCGEGPPSWEVRARHADVVPGDRALLDWPVLYVTPRFLGIGRPVPVLALPWGYLPLAERQTGLLLPDLRFDRNGFGAGLPVFLVLSRSWDATVTPEWITGPSAAQVAADRRGVRGPGLGLELRWAPAEGEAGQARLHLVHSTIGDWPDGTWRPPGMDRIALQLRHEQRLSASTALFADLSAVGDPDYVADFTGDVLLRGAAYRRSAAWLAHRTENLLLSGEADYLEPLAALDSGDPARRAPFGRFGTDLSTFHRLPSLAAELLPTALAGPLHVAGRASLARFAPLRGASGDEGADGIGPGDRGWGAPAVGSVRAPSIRPFDAGERDGAWQPGERLAATRLQARAELSAPLRAGRFALAEPWLAADGAGYAFEAARDPQASGRLAGGLALSTELSRRFGEGEREGEGKVLHALVPRVEWRFGSRAAGPALPSGYAFDDADLAPAPPVGDPLHPARTLSAAPPAGFQQLRIALRNRLLLPLGRRADAALDLDLGQDLDLTAGRRAESWASLALRLPVLTADASARFYALGAGRPPGSPEAPFPSVVDRISELRAGFTLGGPRAELHGSLVALGPGGSQRLAAGADPLFDPRPLGVDPVAQGSAGFRVRWSAATLAYDLYFNARRLTTPVVAGGRTDPHVFQQTARLTWDSPCRCFRLGVVAALREGRALPDLGLTFDLSSLASGTPPAGG